MLAFHTSVVVVSVIMVSVIIIIFIKVSFVIINVADVNGADVSIIAMRLMVTTGSRVAEIIGAGITVITDERSSGNTTGSRVAGFETVADVTVITG